jgi:hypothetical protein
MSVEFNNGFITALALFYAHRFYNLSAFETIHKVFGPDLRLYGGSDHLLNIQIPSNIDPDLRRKVEDLVSKVKSLRYAELTKDEVEEIFDECLEILKELDRRLFGLEVIVNYP